MSSELVSLPPRVTFGPSARICVHVPGVFRDQRLAHWDGSALSGRILLGKCRQARAISGKGARAQRFGLTRHQLEGAVRANQHGGVVKKLS